MKKIDEMSKEELIALVKILKKRKKYGIVWEDKPEDVVEQCKKELPVLQEVKDKAIEVDKDLPTNLLIEGDNYHATSVLNYTHAGKIDVIYLDPPYNTGAKDWKYNNRFVDMNDNYRHSKWLSFMNNRLQNCKRLLKDDGVLIITIDDNELFHLGSLLEDIFPTYEMYIITIEHNRRGRRGKNFAKTNEWALFLVPKGLDRIQEEKTETTIGGETRNLRRTGSGSKRSERPRKFYPIWVNKNTLEVVEAGNPLPLNSTWKKEEEGGLISIYPIDEQGREKNWHYGVERTRECINNKQLKARVQKYGIQVYYTLREKESKKYKTVWVGAQFDASTYGSVELEQILGESGKFDYPKSIYAVLECLKATVGNQKDAVILDFFAGSGTTGHAVMLLNKEDNGNRKFILCTNNENGIAEDVCYPRIKNVIKGYSDIEGIPANVRYFKTSFVSKSKVSDDTRKALLNKSTEMICIRENTFEKIEDKTSFKIYKDAKHSTGILFDLDSLEELKKKLREQKLPSNIYVFSLTNDTFDEDFEDLGLKHKLCPIPESILEVYRKLFNK